MKTAVIALAILVCAFIAVLIFAPDVIPDFGNHKDRRIAIAETCLGVLPEDKRIGLKADLQKSGSLIVDIGGSQERSGTENETIVSRVLHCIEKAYTKENFSNTFVSKKPLPVGLIAQQWQNADLSIHLERPDSDERNVILHNLRFPAAAGEKNSVLSEWCEEFSSCVKCDPASNTAQFSSAKTVTIWLKDDAPVQKKKMWGTWSNPKDLWELIDDSGIRYYYVCKEEE